MLNYSVFLYKEIHCSSYLGHLLWYFSYKYILLSQPFLGLPSTVITNINILNLADVPFYSFKWKK